MDELADPVSIDERLGEVARARHLAAALLRGPAAADVDDVLQEASVATLQRGFSRLGSGVSFGEWIRGTVRHLSITVLRRRSRRRTREHAAARPESIPAAVDVAQRLALQRALLAAVEGLSEPIRAAIVRRYFDELPPRAIATELGAPVATVKTRLRRGLEQLREKLQKEWGERLTAGLMVLSTGGAETAAAPSSAAFGAGTVFGAKTKVAMSAAALIVLGVGLVSIAYGPREPDDPQSAAAVVDPQDSSSGPASASPAAPAMRIPAPEMPAGRSRLERLGARRVGSLVGRVVDENGEGQASAMVSIVRPVEAELNVDTNALTQVRLGERHETTSGPEGTFVFDELVRGRAFDVFAFAADGRSARVLDVPAGRESPVILSLKQTARIEGVVVDARDGTPAANATVCTGDLRADGRERLAAITDASGAYVLDDLDDEFANVSATTPDGRCSPRYSPPLKRGETTHVCIEVGRAGAGAGIVVDAVTGHPISGAAVMLRPEDDLVATRTAADGTFSVRPSYVSSGDFVHARVVSAGHVSQDFELKVASDPNATPPFTRIKLERGLVAVGKVVAPDGTPLAGAVLFASYAKSPGSHPYGVLDSTGPDGSFRIEGIGRTADHVLVVRHDEAESRSFPFPPVEPNQDEIDFGTIRVGPGTMVSGAVLDESGAPVTKASVYLTDEAKLTLGTDCDEQGRFELTGISAGRVQLRASADGTSSEIVLAIDVVEDAIVESVTLTLPTGLSISGRVIDASGRAVRDAQLLLRSQVGRGKFGRAKTDEDGSFHFAGLDSSLCSIQVTPPTSPDSRSMMARVESVEPGNSNLEIVLPDGYAIAGRVVDGDDAPIAGAHVRAIDVEGTGVDDAFTDPTGSFRILTGSSDVHRLEVRVYDRKHPIPLMKQSPVATMGEVYGDDPPVTIVVEAR